MARISATQREQVRRRGNGRCEYCRLPEEFSTYKHQVDHIIPHKHGGSDHINNLAWACFRCNNNKSTDVASYDPKTTKLFPLYNPRQQDWDDHFAIEDGFIYGKTPEGRVTVNVLHMNADKRVETRRDLIEADLW